MYILNINAYCITNVNVYASHNSIRHTGRNIYRNLYTYLNNCLTHCINCKFSKINKVFTKLGIFIITCINRSA